MLHYATLHYITLHYFTTTTTTTLITLHYSYNSTTLQLQLRYTKLHPAVVGEVITATIATTPKTQLQPPFGPSVDSLCHPWFTTVHLSYKFTSPISFLFLKLPPPLVRYYLYCKYAPGVLFIQQWGNLAIQNGVFGLLFFRRFCKSCDLERTLP